MANTDIVPLDFYLTKAPSEQAEGVQEYLNDLADCLGCVFDPSFDTSAIILGQLDGVLPQGNVGPWANNSEWWFWNSTTGRYQRGDENIPVGIIAMWGGTGTPANNNWLLCDGSEVLRDTYNILFQTIGTTWGAGDGATTFNLPPGAKMFMNAPGVTINSLVPLDPNYPNRSGVGARGGTQLSPYLMATNLPKMFLQIAFQGFNSPTGVYGMPTLRPSGGGSQFFEYQLTDQFGAPLNQSEQTMFSIMPPFAACNYIIKYQ